MSNDTDGFFFAVFLAFGFCLLFLLRVSRCSLRDKTRDRFSRVVILLKGMFSLLVIMVLVKSHRGGRCDLPSGSGEKQRMLVSRDFWALGGIFEARSDELLNFVAVEELLDSIRIRTLDKLHELILVATIEGNLHGDGPATLLAR